MKRDDAPTPTAGHQNASAAVTAALGTLAYPITKKDAIARVGRWQIPYDRETQVALGSLLSAVPQDAFGDVGQAQRAVDQHWGRIARTLDQIEQAQREAAGKRRKRA